MVTEVTLDDLPNDEAPVGTGGPRRQQEA